MQIRRGSRWAILFLLFVSLSVRAAEPSPQEAAKAMLDAERKFYETGQKQGTRAAFLVFLANDGIVFHPGPVNGQEAWGKRPETGFDLVWEPTFATMARSADFGYTTGPAKWRANKKEKKFGGYGHFVSIWKNQGDGTWKVALDLGIEHQEPVRKTEPLRLSIPEADSNARVDFDVRHKRLQEAQTKFAETAKRNSSDATLGIADDGIRVYRDGSFPAVGKRAAKTLLEAKAGKMSFEPMGGEMSRTADLAYSYGKYSLSRDGNSEAGHFLQIWQIDAAGSWKLVLDWQQPLPPEKS